MLITGLSFWSVIRMVTRPLGDLAGAMRELSDGNLGAVLPGIDAADEIGKVANAVVKFRDNVTEQQRLADEFARAVKERETLSASMETALTSFRTTSDEILRRSTRTPRRCARPRRR